MKNADTSSDRRAQMESIRTAIQCQNRRALQRLLASDPSILLWHEDISTESSGEQKYGQPHTILLHHLGESFGWNDDIAMILSRMLRQLEGTSGRRTTRDVGLFQSNEMGETPLSLALTLCGADLEEIVRYLHENEPAHLEENLHHLPRFIAEYCLDMSLMQMLLDDYASHLLPQLPSDPSLISHYQQDVLYYACEYQNAEMIAICLQHCCFHYNEDEETLLKRLKAPWKSDKAEISNDTKAYHCKSPLGSLIIALGNMDPDMAFECLRTCQHFVPNHLNLLRHTFEEDVVWEALMRQGRVYRTLTRMLPILLDTNQDDGEDGASRELASLQEWISIWVSKLATWQLWPETMRIWQFLFEHGREIEVSTVLHHACRAGLQWQHGLQMLVKRHPEALQEEDLDTRLVPFLSSATCASKGNINLVVYPKGKKGSTSRRCRSISDSSMIGTIYELLRSNPGVLEQQRRG